MDGKFTIMEKNEYILIVPISKDKNYKKYRRMHPISWNEYERFHWGTRKLINDLWYDYISTLKMKHRVPLLKHPKITFKFYFPTRARRDWFNFTIKPLADALVNAGIIIDDQDRYVNIEKPVMEYDKENPRTEIHIEVIK